MVLYYLIVRNDRLGLILHLVACIPKFRPVHLESVLILIYIFTVNKEVEFYNAPALKWPQLHKS